MRTSGVYQILNTRTGNSYVGSAVNMDMRWRAHRHSLRRHKKSPPKLQAVWDRDGEAVFTFRVLLVCDKHNLLMYEQAVIDALRPKYNTRLTAESNFGVRWSEETNMAKGRPTRFLEWEGKQVSERELARRYGLDKNCLRQRIRRGWTVEAALTTPFMSHAERGRKGQKNRGN